MLLARVTGVVVATRKAEKLVGAKLLVVRPVEGNDNLIVAADFLGAGVGDDVLVTTGSSARVALSRENVPVDAVIVGIVDSVKE